MRVTSTKMRPGCTPGSRTQPDSLETPSAPVPTTTTRAPEMGASDASTTWTPRPLWRRGACCAPAAGGAARSDAASRGRTETRRRVMGTRVVGRERPDAGRARTGRPLRAGAGPERHHPAAGVGDPELRGDLA